MAFTPLTASTSGNTASGSVTVPAGMTSGSVGIVIFTQNNTDVVTGVPTWLTSIPLGSSGSTSFVNRLYWFRVGDGTGGTVTAGTAAAFTMSATRAWTLTLYGVDGVDTGASPVVLVADAGTGTASTAVMPTGTTTEALWLVEVPIMKSNGAAITALAPPGGSGWTQQVFTPAPTTFGGAVAVLDRDAGVAGAGTYGGETYTPTPATSSSTQRLIIGFRPAPVTLTTYTPVSDVTTTGWGKVPTTAASFAAVLSDIDNATYAESPGTPSGALLEVALGPVTVPTDLSTVTYSTDLWWANGAATATAVMTLLQGGTVKKTGPTLTLTSTPTSYTLALSAADAGALTKTGAQWLNLTLRVVATAS